MIADKTVSHIIVKESSATYHRTEMLGELAGVQIAYPFLERALTEAVLDLDESELYQGTTNKVALRRWLERNAPAYVHRKPKGFFAVPVEWLLPRHEAEFRAHAREPARMHVCRAGLPEAQVGELLRKHLAGHREVDLAVWALLVLESWIGAHTS